MATALGHFQLLYYYDFLNIYAWCLDFSYLLILLLFKYALFFLVAAKVKFITLKKGWDNDG